MKEYKLIRENITEKIAEKSADSNNGKGGF